MVAAFDLSHRRAIPYPTGKRHSGIDAALQPDLLRHRSAALPTGPSIAEHLLLAMQTGLHRNTISKVYRQLKPMGWWKPWPAPASTCATSRSRREIKTPPHIRNRGVDLDREGASVDGLLNAGCTLRKPGNC